MTPRVLPPTGDAAVPLSDRYKRQGHSLQFLVCWLALGATQSVMSVGKNNGKVLPKNAGWGKGKSTMLFHMAALFPSKRCAPCLCTYSSTSWFLYVLVQTLARDISHTLPPRTHTCLMHGKLNLAT